MTNFDDNVSRLRVLSRDLWWSWNEIAQRPFAMIDPVLWEATNHDPIAVLTKSAPERLRRTLESDAFAATLTEAEEARDAAHARESWFGRTRTDADENMRIAYYCSEFAIHESMQQYSGGLGVLAGDHIKSASDLGIPLVGVGLLYRHGYYVQQLESDGATRVLYPDYDFASMPIEDTGTAIKCPIGQRSVHARVWRLQVGRVPIYLLDADHPDNRQEDRELTQGLYKGEPRLRMRQQVLLGVGGVLALAAVGEEITVDHLNEGHAAFAAVQRVREAIERGLSFEDAVAEVRARTVFTTHTPVPAGHDRYANRAVCSAMRPVLKAAGLEDGQLTALGADLTDKKNPFCMTVLAFSLAQHVNGVAQLHGRVSREMWSHHFDVERPEDVPIGAITNGVHPRTWLEPSTEAFWKRTIGLDLDDAKPNEVAWSKAESVDGGELWALRSRLRARLVRFLRERLVAQARRRGANATDVVSVEDWFDPGALTICFARRFATYKRAPLIFRDRERLASILAAEGRPVQIVFAGKAHPRDEGGQAFLQTVFGHALDDAFRGRVAVLDEYDMHVGRMLTSGADVWLNTPRRPHEASGTSGMKPPMHGGLNCSILDGWWPEGFDGTNGWVIGDDFETTDEEESDARDAAALYDLLEQEVVPAFYDRDEHGLPQRWLEMAKRSVVTVPAQFSTHRMVAEYLDQAYRQAAVEAV